MVFVALQWTNRSLLDENLHLSIFDLVNNGMSYEKILVYLSGSVQRNVGVWGGVAGGYRVVKM